MFWIMRGMFRRRSTGRRPGVYPKAAGWFFAFFVFCVIVGACHGGG
jgi:hypothetical protein